MKSKEYLRAYGDAREPINDRDNQLLYERYRALAARYPNVIFGGRFGEYRYYNMDQAIASAFAVVDSIATMTGRSEDAGR